MMVMPDREWPVAVAIRVGIGNLCRNHMDMRRLVIVIGLGQSDSGPVGCMSEVVLRLRNAVQVHGRQDGDAETDTEVAHEVRQWGLLMPL